MSSDPTRIDISGGEAACFRLVREQRDLPVVARFTIEGEPCSKARARFTKRGSRVLTYTPEKTKQAEEHIAQLFRQVVIQDHEPDDRDITYGVMALFFCGNRQRRDVDNMLKLILDGLNKVAWPDDEQVIEISGRKTLTLEFPDDARTEVVIYRVGKVQYYTATCLRCGKEYRTYPSWTDERRLRKYCSPECTYEHRREMNKRSCAACGAEFQRGDRPKSKYCSTECGRKFQGGRPKKVIECD